MGALDLKSPELEDFATPLGPAPDLWPQIKNMTSVSHTGKTFNSSFKNKSPSATDINAIVSVQNSVHNLNMKTNPIRREHHLQHTNAMLSASLPTYPNDNPDTAGLRFSETHFDVNGDVLSSLDPNAKHTRDDDNNSQKSQNDGGPSDSPFFISSEMMNNRNEILCNNEYSEAGYLGEPTSIVLGHHGAFLDTMMMSSSPSANYYRPTEEPEPLDLTQLNIEASVMCLVSKVKFLCGRCGSPAVRLRQPRGSIKRGGFNSMPPDVVTSQPISKTSHEISMESSNHSSCDDPTTSLSGTPTTASVENSQSNRSGGTMTSKDLNLVLAQAVGEVTRKVKKGNKFTDGLDLSLTTDWASELRPSMRKLRQAMDGLLKTARLMHSVQRLQQDMKKTATILSIMYRRDVCFSQALTSLVAGLMNKLWATSVNESYIHVLCNLGPLAYFEGLLSLYGGETDMWGDMSVAIEDLSTVRFTLFRGNIQRENKALPIPRVIGSRQSITVLLPVPDSVYCILPTKESVTFKVTPVFFNIGINEKATLAETLGFTKEQHRSNWDNFDRLKQYFIRYKKLQFTNFETPTKREQSMQTVAGQLTKMEDSLRNNVSKNVKILHLAEDVCRGVNGIRFTSCKSAKDRTAMAVTLEQCRILQEEFHLPECSLQTVLNTMRSEGTRSENTLKNIGLRKYAFNMPQILSLPQMYRPPAGSFGKAQT